MFLTTHFAKIKNIPAVFSEFDGQDQLLFRTPFLLLFYFIFYIFFPNPGFRSKFLRRLATISLADQGHQLSPDVRQCRGWRRRSP